MADFESIITYWIPVILSLILCRISQKRNLEKNHKKIFWALLISLPLSLVAGCRYGVGTDYYPYLEYFQYISSHDLLTCYRTMILEPVFIGIVRFFSVAGFNEYAIFGIIEFIIIFNFAYALLELKDHISVSFTFFLFYLLLYHYSLNIIRQFLAISFVFVAVVRLLNNRWKSAIVFWAIGVLIHASAFVGILFLTIYFIEKRIYSRAPQFSNASFRHMNGRYAFIWFGILLVPFISDLVLKIAIKIPFLAKYSNAFSNTNSYLMWIVKSAALFLPIIMACYKKIISDKRLSMLTQFALVHILLLSFSGAGTWVGRISFYTLSISIMLIAVLLNTVKKRSLNKAILMVYYIGVFMYNYIVKTVVFNYGGTFPYISVFTR